MDNKKMTKRGILIALLVLAAVIGFNCFTIDF